MGGQYRTYPGQRPVRNRYTVGNQGYLRPSAVCKRLAPGAAIIQMTPPGYNGLVPGKRNDIS